MIRKNLYILFLLASVYSFAQVNLYSEVNTKEARVNNPFVFTVVLEIFGKIWLWKRLSNFLICQNLILLFRLSRAHL
jgi:hypothetical protein